MTDEEFFQRLAIESNFSDVEVGKAAYLGLLRILKKELVEQGMVFMPLWGVFDVIERGPRRTIDYHTRRPIVIPAHKAVKWKACDRLFKYFRDKR